MTGHWWAYFAEHRGAPARALTHLDRAVLLDEHNARLHCASGDTLAALDRPAEAQAAVFDRFHQVGEVLGDRPKGTGLGLPICRQIVRAHGSELALVSAPDEGSRFMFTIRW